MYWKWWLGVSTDHFHHESGLRAHLFATLVVSILVMMPTLYEFTTYDRKICALCFDIPFTALENTASHAYNSFAVLEGARDYSFLQLVFRDWCMQKAVLSLMGDKKVNRFDFLSTLKSYWSNGNKMKTFEGQIVFTLLVLILNLEFYRKT